MDVEELAGVSPELAASELLGAGPSDEWLQGLVASLNRSLRARSSSELAEVLEVWGLSRSEFASLMGLSRQAVSKWFDRLPGDRAVAVADLAAATEILLHYVRRHRIPAVVRRPAAALDGHSLVDLVGRGDTAGVRAAVEAMFDPARAVS